ncbi:3-hydroxybutyryl-CoA dehydrogenase (EC [Olavius sp. associated proteobacterium Delta 1]|nr:3-hydroxybutyryl-CoA dehydrogenase (EC [Olavius sp. associated proteobacterium Delta 1]
MTAESIAIVGPGRMGVGIATAVLMANQGYTATLIDTKKRQPGKENEALDSAREEVNANLELLDGLEMLHGDAATLSAALGVSTGLEQTIAGCSFVFEALPEKVTIKQDFYRAIGPHMDKDTVLASATSTFHLDVFWDVCTRPGNVVSAHWLNPAFLIPLVEVTHGEKTHEWASDGMCDFLRSIGKTPVKMKTSPGFIVPRIQAAAMNEAIRILQEGVTTAQEIDTAIKAGFGFRLAVMGLIEFVDLGGVDILFHAGEYLHNKLGGDQFKPPQLVREKMAREEMGPRTDKGFYDYKDVDTRKLFHEKYMGFAELLHLYERSKYLNFAGGIAVDAPPGTDPTTAKRKDKP